MRANHLSAEQEPRRAAAIVPAAEPDPELARVVRLAARVVRAPIAVLAMFDEGELQLISWPGLATALTPMVASFLRELSSAELSFLELDPWQLPSSPHASASPLACRARR